MTSDPKNWQAQLAELPVSRFFSDKTWRAIQEYLSVGSSAQRGYRLMEFMKALDWLPMDEIEPNPLKQFSVSEARRLKQEIKAYFEDKKQRRKTQREKQEAYRLRVFEYYRIKLSPEEKTLLEKLRDYELERIGMDVNWRHYFWFTSFKQIDAFINQSRLERKTQIERFKQDVELHYKNAQRLREGSYAQYYWGSGFESAGETFDEWVNRQTGARDGQRDHQHKQSASQTMAPGTGLQEAYRLLGVSPLAPLREIRQQFRRLAQQYHPDKPDGSEEKMKQLLASYNMVKKVRQTADEVV